MDINEFRKYAHEFVDWIADYYSRNESYPVKSQVSPGEIFGKLPELPPDEPENMDRIFSDFQDIILPGITHWQSPNFFAYFPANSSFPSVLAEMLTSALAAQCMKWETSPAAAELEEKIMNWLKVMLGLPEEFSGVIQDTASTSTLAAILSAREYYSGFRVNSEGFRNYPNFRVYCSSETHSSIEKAVKIAGIGRNNLVKIRVDDKYAMDSEALGDAVRNDIKSGKKPLCVIATIGTTGSTAIDPLADIASVCREYDIWLHVDAAFAGSALILPEFRWMLKGIEDADSFVFNPHKWLFTNFDCSVYYVKDRGALVQTFEIIPEYLKTLSDAKRVNNYCDWGIPLGRRFRALKLWFVIREFGVRGLQEKLRNHISTAKEIESVIADDSRFELLAPVPLALVCFRYVPDKSMSEDEINLLNEKILHAVNRTGRAYITHTKLNGKYSLRMVTAQTNVTREHALSAFELIKSTAEKICEKI